MSSSDDASCPQAWVTKHLWDAMVEKNGANIQKLNRIQDEIYDKKFFNQLSEFAIFPKVEGGHAQIREISALLCAPSINRVSVSYYFNEHGSAGENPEATPTDASLNFYTKEFCSMMMELRFDATATEMPKLSEKIVLKFRDLMWQGQGGFSFSEKHETRGDASETSRKYSYEAVIQAAGFATPCYISKAETWLAAGANGWWRLLLKNHDSQVGLYEPINDMTTEMAAWEQSYESQPTTTTIPTTVSAKKWDKKEWATAIPIKQNCSYAAITTRQQEPYTNSDWADWCAWTTPWPATIQEKATEKPITESKELDKPEPKNDTAQEATTAPETKEASPRQEHSPSDDKEKGKDIESDTSLEPKKKLFRKPA